jgi:hypothetical protein
MTLDERIRENLTAAARSIGPATPGSVHDVRRAANR